MKLLILFLIAGLSPPEYRVDRFPASNSPYSGCDSKEIAAGVLHSDRVPRATIFHYGKKEVLLKDVTAGNIPEQDWDDYIMGEKTRFKLKPFRRGFYGTEYAEDADRFGDSTYNWLVEIELKPECLVPSRVVSLVYLPQSEVFRKWYDEKGFSTTFTQWKEFCFDSQNYPRSKYFIDYKNPSETANFNETGCEGVVARYYGEQKYAFIHDYAGDLVRSWAIRDRSCIQKINGSDEYWAHEFATREEFWVNTCSRERDHRNNIRVWFSAIVEAGITPTLTSRFSKMIKTLQSPSDTMNPETQDLDRFAAQDFGDELHLANQRCRDRPVAFKNALKEIAANVKDLQSSEVRSTLESICR